MTLRRSLGFNSCGSKWFLLLKPFPYIPVSVCSESFFPKTSSISITNYKLPCRCRRFFLFMFRVVDGIQTNDFWCQKRPLRQLSRHHWPKVDCGSWASLIRGRKRPENSLTLCRWPSRWACPARAATRPCHLCWPEAGRCWRPRCRCRRPPRPPLGRSASRRRWKPWKPVRVEHCFWS